METVGARTFGPITVETFGEPLSPEAERRYELLARLYEVAGEKEWNEEDHPRDEIGRFAWAGGGGIAGKLANLIRVSGGFTYQPVTDSQPKTGKMVGKPGHEKTFKGIPTVAQIRGYLVENATEFKDPAAYCGGWHNPEDDTTYLDVSERYETDEEAAAASIAAHQEAYFDLATGETTYVRAREAESIEAKARLVQARDERRGDPANHRRDVGDRSPEDRWEALRAILLKEFDPNQPRDERGQWTSDGGGGSVDQRIADAAGRGVVSASRVPFSKPAFITENDRVVYNTGRGFRSHEGLARDLGYEQTIAGNAAEKAIEDGLIRVEVESVPVAWSFDLQTAVYLEAKDTRSLVRGARLVNRSLNEEQRSNARYVWETHDRTGEGTLKEILDQLGPVPVGRKVWQRLKAILTEEKFDPNQPRDEAGRWTSDGGGVAQSEHQTYRDRLERTRSVDKRIQMAEEHGSIEVSRIPPRERATFVTEDGRFLTLPRDEADNRGSHDWLAYQMGYQSEFYAIYAGLSRTEISHIDFPEPHLGIAIEARDMDHIQSTARAIQRSFDEDEKASANYVWEASYGKPPYPSGSGSYRELIGRKTLWQRLKAIFVGEKRSQDQLARDRLALNRLGAERLARLAEDAINDYVPELSRGISETTYDAIKGAVVMARSEGGGSIEVQRAIDHLFSPERAQRVAITETTRLFGKGSQAVYREQGVTGWQWSTCNDPWVCAICEELEDEVFEADDEFEPAHVNCRCFPRPYMIETGD